jgi:hypothetical protein
MSISQGVEKSGRGEYACFVGFWGCFLEIALAAVADGVNLLCFSMAASLLVVVFAEQVPHGTWGT